MNRGMGNQIPQTRKKLSPGWGVKIAPLRTLPVHPLRTKKQAMRAFVALLKREPDVWDYIDRREG